LAKTTSENHSAFGDCLTTLELIKVMASARLSSE